MVDLIKELLKLINNLTNKKNPSRFLIVVLSLLTAILIAIAVGKKTMPDNNSSQRTTISVNYLSNPNALTITDSSITDSRDLGKDFNVANVFVNLNKITTLQEHKYLEDGFAAVPVKATELWESKIYNGEEASIEELTRINYYSCGSKLSLPANASGLLSFSTPAKRKSTGKDGTAGRKVFAWYKKDENNLVSLSYGSSKPKCMRLFPRLYTYTIGEKWINDKADFLGDLSNQLAGKDLGAKIKKTKQGQDPKSLSADDTITNNILSTKNLFGEELIGLFLVQELFNIITLSVSQPEIKTKIETIKKEKNMLHIKLIYTVQGKVQENESFEAVTKNLFVFSSGATEKKKALVVDITLPHHNKHYLENLKWAQQWINGLKVWSPHTHYESLWSPHNDNSN